MSRATVVLARKEFRDALRNRWFLLDAGAFVVLALGVSFLGLAGGDISGIAGFGRTSAALMNLVLLIVPLMGLSVGALSLSSERERGTLATLLSHPVTRGELLAGKWLGLAGALAVAVAVGFGLPGLIVAGAASAERAGAYLALAGLAFLLALAGLAIGMVVSATARTTAVAVGVAVVLWLVLVFAGDLGLLGAGLAMHLGDAQLLALALANPLTAFRVAAILASGASPETLGPAGVLLEHELGAWDVPLLVALLALWATVPLAFCYRILTRTDLM
jgi:Cu-processing system permease protein